MQDRLERVEVACSHGEEVVKKTESEREAVQGKMALLAKEKTQLEAEVIRGVSWGGRVGGGVGGGGEGRGEIEREGEGEGKSVRERENVHIIFCLYTCYSSIQSKCPCKWLTTPVLGLLALPMLCNTLTA